MPPSNIAKKKDDHHPVIQHQRKGRTFAEYSADLMTEFMGSWTFILVFLFFLGLWAALNVVAWVNHWDPYPFILLNLVLSMVSALQAPIIMMSQNRQSDRDRINANYDYAVNRKTEREMQQVMKELATMKQLLQKIEKKIQ